MKNTLLMAAIDAYQAQKTEALAHLEILFNDATTSPFELQPI